MKASGSFKRKSCDDQFDQSYDTVQDQFDQSLDAVEAENEESLRMENAEIELAIRQSLELDASCISDGGGKWSRSGDGPWSSSGGPWSSSWGGKLSSSGGTRPGEDLNAVVSVGCCCFCD